MGLNNVGLSDFSELSDNINELINNALEVETRSQPPREYLGGSRVGVECARALYYEFSNHPKDPEKDFTGKVIRRFKMGHIHEAETAKWLKQAGFKLITEKEDGGQFGFSLVGGKIRGHIDGIITGGPDLGKPFPMLWEHKIMKNSKWNDCKKNGLQQANFTYFAQVQIYMAYMSPILNMDLGYSLFTSLNTDTSELYFELVPYNPQIAQQLSDRAVTIIRGRSPEDLPRVTKDKNDFRCKFCAYQESCWNPAALANGQKIGNLIY